MPMGTGLDEMLSGLREAFDHHQSGGHVTPRYDTRPYLGRL